MPHKVTRGRERRWRWIFLRVPNQSKRYLGWKRGWRRSPLDPGLWLNDERVGDMFSGMVMAVALVNLLGAQDFRL